MPDDVRVLEALSDAVLLGLCGTSSIFYIDHRESNNPKYVINSNQYRNDGSTNGAFYSLSCNKTNAYEFAVGTDYNARIYDFRQMKPFYEFYHNYDNLEPRECNVSWSPNGKYIYIYDREFRTYSNTICLFWDVFNSERVMSSNDTIVEGSGEIFEWTLIDTDSFAWIDDRLLIASYDNAIFSVTPNTKTVTPIDNSIIRDTDIYTGPIVSGMVYNNQTRQLVGSNCDNMIIWSHYKLPSYPKLGRDNFVIDKSME